MLSRARESVLSFKRKAAATASALGMILWLEGCATPSQPAQSTALPQDELTLAAADPVVTVTIAGRTLRLLVDPAQWDSIELNPDVADHLPVIWQKGRDLEIGRVILAGRVAPATLEADGRRLPVLLSSHGRIVATNVDGLVGPDLLPFGTVRWRSTSAPSPTASLRFAILLDPSIGLVSIDPQLALPIRVRFSLTRPDSEATGAAGSFLVQRYGGGFDGPARDEPVLLGVSRPARPLAFARPPTIAGFRFASLIVRIADFRGDNPLPEDKNLADDIVIRRREVPQPAQSWVTIGKDRLARCAELTYTAQPRSLTLSCAF